jgi:hypothetical protein
MQWTARVFVRCKVRISLLAQAAFGTVAIGSVRSPSGRLFFGSVLPEFKEIRKMDDPSKLCGLAELGRLAPAKLVKP